VLSTSTIFFRHGKNDEEISKLVFLAHEYNIHLPRNYLEGVLKDFDFFFYRSKTRWMLLLNQIENVPNTTSVVI